MAKTNDFGIRSIATNLGLKDSQVYGILLDHKIRVPLSERVIKRLGTKKIENIRKAYRKGLSETEIQRKFKCNRWTLRLILLDEPSLSDTHSRAKAARYRKKHRAVIRKLMVKNPNISRDEIHRKHNGTYAHMLKNDKKWFHSKIRKGLVGIPIKPRQEKLNWRKIDQQKADELQKHLSDTLNLDFRPKQITETAMLRDLKILQPYHKNQSRFPVVKKILDEHIETYEAYMARKIEWAIKNSRKGETISLTTLRKKVSIESVKLKGYRAIVVKLAEKYRVPIDEKSFFACP